MTQFKELDYSAHAMQPKSQFSSGNLAQTASTPRSLVAQFKELDYSAQAMQPKSQFSSGNFAQTASATRSPATQFKELNYSAQTMQPRSQFSSGSQPTEPQQPSLKSSTTLLRQFSPNGLSAQEPSSSV